MDKDPGLIENRKNAVFFKISLIGSWALTQILKKVKKAKPGLDPKLLRIKPRYLHELSNEPSNKIELKKVRNKNVIKQKLYYNKYKILFLKKKNVIIFKLANLRKPWNVYYTILNFYRKTLQLRV